ncbi:MAG: helix-turn-helix transcriptional regulator [Clostridia bacterium]|nr:helix-turn-helix transcriptional regulator [Clostridia bacterium]
MQSTTHCYSGVTVREYTAQWAEHYAAVSDEYEIIHIKEGECTISVEGAEYPLGSQALAVVSPRSYRRITSEDSALSFTVISFRRASLVTDVLPMLDKIAPQSGADCYIPKLGELSISDFYSRLSETESLPEAEGALLVRILLSELVLRLSLLTSGQDGSEEGDLIAEVIRYLNGNLTADISLDSLSRRFFVSKYYLCRAFKRRSGISIHGYVTAKRIAYAKQLIAKGETATSVAYKVGYGDYSAFYRAYLKETGTSPTGTKTD